MKTKTLLLKNNEITAAEVRQTKKDEIFDSNGLFFSAVFEKLKKKENLQTSVSSRDKKETKILQYAQSRIF